jgi:hypothetical protein
MGCGEGIVGVAATMRSLSKTAAMLVGALLLVQMLVTVFETNAMRSTNYSSPTTGAYIAVSRPQR